MNTIKEKREVFKEKYENLISSLEVPTKYTTNNDNLWHSFRCNDTLPDQGWKIHIGVVLIEAIEMVNIVSSYCFKNNLDWKVLSTFKNLERSLFGGSGLFQSGKQVTIYFESKDYLFFHIENLHQLTKNFQGPKILTDYQYKKGSCVFFRYGGFKEKIIYNQFSGEKIHAISEPNGELVEDIRKSGHFKPYWILSPLEKEEIEDNEMNEFKSRNLSIEKVLKQAGPGGVFQADICGKRRILKEARLNMCSDLLGRTKKDQLINEYYVLSHLKQINEVENVKEQFDYQENSYLILEYIDGKSLEKYVNNMHHSLKYDWEELDYIINQIRKAIKKIHLSGCIIRDLSPGNIIISSKNIKMIDFEHSHINSNSNSQVPFEAFTPGFVPIGFERDDRLKEEFDWFAFGAIQYYIATNIDMEFQVKNNAIWMGKLEAFIETIENDSLQKLADQGLKIMKDSLKKLEICEEVDKFNFTLLQSENFEKEKEEMINYLLHKIDFTEQYLNLDHSKSSKLFSEISFISGNSGLLYFLLNEYNNKKTLKLKIAIEKIITWILNHYHKNKKLLPNSFYYGIGCLPELLLYAANLLKTEEYEHEAKRIANFIRSKPTTQYNMSHGLSGLGLSFLYCYQNTGDEFYLELVNEIFELLISGMEENCGIVKWKVLDKTDKGTKAYYPMGYFYGIAGIGYFIASYYDITNNQKAKSILKKISYTLKTTAKITEDGKGLLWTRMFDYKGGIDTSWSNGTAGIVIFFEKLTKTQIDSESNLYFQRSLRSLLDTQFSYSTNYILGIAGICDVLNSIGPSNVETNNKILGLLKKMDIVSVKKEIIVWNLKNEWVFPIDYLNGYLGIYDTISRIYNKQEYKFSFLRN